MNLKKWQWGHTSIKNNSPTYITQNDYKIKLDILVVACFVVSIYVLPRGIGLSQIPGKYPGHPIISFSISPIQLFIPLLVTW